MPAPVRLFWKDRSSAQGFRTGTEQECALTGAFDTFAEPSANTRNLRQADLRHETENFRFGSKPAEVD